MAKDSKSERERLKEEYKAHYRKMREIKERASRAKRTQNIASALKSMDKTEMLNSFDDFLYSVKHKLASVEARLDLALDSLGEKHDADVNQQEMGEEIRKSKAKDTLRQVKLEMGLLYNEIEEQANNIQVNKTIGRNSSAFSDKPGNELEDE